MENVLHYPKRICHGIKLFEHPHLIEQMTKEGVCIEVCPMSNIILGHVTDLRHHPIRYLLRRGLQISLSSGHHGLLGYDDVTLDYLAAYLAWDLSLRDLKRISLNGIDHSSCEESVKD